MCVLRNLSYQLESEVDLQDGAEDVLDRDWEAEQRRDLEDFSAARPKKASTPGCLSMCTRPKTTDSARHSSPPPAHPDSRRSYVSRPSVIVDFANPDPSVFPKRNRQVQGVALLWQPEVVFPYLATLDLYGGCADTLEAAAGAIQNITACSWKWAVYARNMIRAVTGLRVMAELLNNGHDAVVRAGATCLRNLSTDPRNKASLGSLVIPAIIPRLPFGSNHLGISESTTVASWSSSWRSVPTAVTTPDYSETKKAYPTSQGYRDHDNTRQRLSLQPTRAQSSTRTRSVSRPSRERGGSSRPTSACSGSTLVTWGV
ncbi:Catenin delta-2 [Geodia barretti]|uniref:Catenin delta-2 n=1 Tax=Geodia barretti TaxID=519541 RepID=A0AA35QYD9_GEOBA|nr:Catenin delta-2 [Geodia barretti]